jgi:hypothetical protein
LLVVQYHLQIQIFLVALFELSLQFLLFSD